MNNKFFVIEVSVTADGTAKAITEKTSVIDAKMLFHQVMAAMMANTNVLVGFCTIVDGYGRQVDTPEYYSKPATEVSEETT